MEQLQVRLRALGYDTGDADGVFGFLTEDALVQFQREHRLRIDGVAGPEVYVALEHVSPGQRTVHVVQTGERMIDVAHQYGVSVPFLRWTNRKFRSSRIYPGERLVLRSSNLLLGHHPRVGPFGTGAPPSQPVSGHVDSTFQVDGDGRMLGDGDPALKALAQEMKAAYLIGIGLPAHDEGNPVSDLLRYRKRLRQFLHHIPQAFADHGATGLFIDAGTLEKGLGRRLLTLVQHLRRRLPEHKIVVAVNPPPPGVKAFLLDVDHAGLARWVDFFVLGFHRWDTLLKNPSAPLRYAEAEQAISRFLRHVPPWKVILGIPFGASFWREEQLVRTVPYRSAVTEAYVQRVRPKQDDSGLLRFIPPASAEAAKKQEQKSEHYVLQGSKSLDKLLVTANYYRLGGTFLYPLGYEDRRQWDVISKRVYAASWR